MTEEPDMLQSMDSKESDVISQVNNNSETQSTEKYYSQDTLLKKDATQRITEGTEYNWLKGKIKESHYSYMQTFEGHLQMGHIDFFLCLSEGQKWD